MIEFNNSTHSPQIRDHILRNQFSLYHVCVSCELWYDKHKSWKVYTILMYPYYRSVRLCWCWAGRVDNLEIGSGTEFVKHGPRCWLKEPAPPAWAGQSAPARARNTGIWPQAAHYKLSSGSNIFTRQETTPHSFLTKSGTLHLIKNGTDIIFEDTHKIDEWCKKLKIFPLSNYGLAGRETKGVALVTAS